MPVKRSRIGRSSSFGETGFMSPPLESADAWTERGSGPPFAAPSKLPATSNSAKAIKPSVEEKSEESRPRILTLSSPTQESVDASGKEPIGGFLDRCYCCKKKMEEDADVFMYSYLRAFCSDECRERQIAMDNAVEVVSGASKGGTT